MTPEASPVISVRDVWKRYGSKRALRGMTFSASAGRLVGVLGENGSGKSTLFRVLAGLTRPDRGVVEVAGLPPGLEARRRTAYLPEVDPFPAWMSVRQVMDFVRSFYDDWDESREEGVLSLMGIPEEGRVGDLSRGQRGRLKVATAFARRAGIVLMDEPLSGIDQPSRAKILEALFGPRRDASQTVLISTHLVHEVEPYIEDVAFVRDGQVVLEGPATAIREERGKSLGDVFTEVAV